MRWLALALSLTLASMHEVQPARAEPPSPPPATTDVARGAGGVHRALLVGIDVYSGFKPAKDAPPPRNWQDLDGAVRDVEGIASLLTGKFGFAPEQVAILTDKAATRAAILDALADLAARTGPDDVVVFYYAGHGSQVKNSLANDEPDGLDESIVPADSRAGAPDIRDDELRDALGRILDKTTRLTVIMDSCHSGSGTRGLGKARSIRGDPRDIATPSSTTPPPEQRGAVVLSAAQDFQLAWEAKDDDGKPHGLFSWSLTRALQQMAPGESVDQLFMRVRTMMQTAGTFQEPVLAGQPERTAAPLFGTSARGGPFTVPGRPDKDGTVRLMGGLAIGLHPGSELVRRATGDKREVRVRTLPDAELARSRAQVIAGSIKDLPAEAGDLFEVVQWAAPQGAAMNVYVPEDAPPLAELTALGPALATLAKDKRLELLDDPLAGPRTHLVYFEGGAWWLLGPSSGADPAALGPRLDATKVTRLVMKDPGPGERARLYVALPPPRELVAQLATGTSGFDNAARVAQLADAQYALSARLTADDTLEVAWVTRDHFAATDRKTSLPPRTDWVALTLGPAGAIANARIAAADLDGKAETLVRIRSWLTLASPGDGGTYPYTLAFRKPGAPTPETPTALAEGETWELVLTRGATSAAIPSRYVYVLIIDSGGGGSLLFPPAGQGNVENYLPRPKEAPPELIALTDIHILPPLGLDTYLLVTSNEPLLALSQVNWSGVLSRTRGTTPGDVSPLEALLAKTGGRTRGAGSVAPSGWSVRQLAIPSVPK